MTSARAASRAWRILTTASRSSAGWYARWTTAKPPSPIFSRSVNSPSVRPSRVWVAGGTASEHNRGERAAGPATSDHGITLGNSIFGMCQYVESLADCFLARGFDAVQALDLVRHPFDVDRRADVLVDVGVDDAQDRD